MRIAVFGHKGFVGKAVFDKLSESFYTIGIDRDNYESFKGFNFEYFVNCNGNSKKYWAEQNPKEDFQKNVQTVYDTIFDFKIQNYIQISSFDIGIGYYGLHKLMAEMIVKKSFSDRCKIIRCSSIVGKDMKKGVVYDILNSQRVFLTPDSKLQFISNTEIANVIHFLIDSWDKKDIGQLLSVGGLEPISVKDIGNILNKKIIYNNELKKEVYDEEINISKWYTIQKSINYIEEMK